MSQENIDTMSRVRVSKFHAVLPPGHRDPPWALWSPIVAAFALRSQRARTFFYGLPRSRVRTALVFRYYRDIIRDITNGDIRRHRRVIDPNASVTLFDMETFRGPAGAEEAVKQWHQSFPDLRYEMSEFINPDGPHVLCVGRLTGGGAISGANVMQELMFSIKIVDGYAVELSLSNDRADALEAVGLSE